jgi:hypothetical protein
MAGIIPITAGVIPTMAVGIILITAVGDGMQAGTAAATVLGIVHGAGVGVLPIGTTIGVMEDIMADTMAAAGIMTIGITTTAITLMQQVEV